MSNLANKFIKECIANRKHVSIFIVNGVQLKGYITDLDKEVIVLEKGHNEEQIVFKSAISTIMPVSYASSIKTKRVYNVKNSSLQAC